MAIFANAYATVSVPLILKKKALQVILVTIVLWNPTWQKKGKKILEINKN